ncbi:MAG: hypothetical protein ACYCOR_21900 [Acidobacteriaceae bacterium]
MWADFGEALAVIAGVEQKAHYLCDEFTALGRRFVTAFPMETTETFLACKSHTPTVEGASARAKI